MDGGYSLVTTSVPSEAEADRLGTSIIEARLAACVQITPIRSIYRWKGAVCHEPEYLLLIKTSSAMYRQLEAHIRKHHSYETAEIVEIAIVSGSPEYLLWIDDCIC